MSFQTVEVIGVVYTVSPIKNNEPVEFKIHCSGMGKTFDAVCSFFCPLRKGDTIRALCKIDANEKLHLVRPPCVQQGLDKDTVVQGFVKILNKGYIYCTGFYEKIANMAGGDELVIAYVSDLAQDWNDTKNKGIMEMFQDDDPTTIGKLLEWWYKDRNLRELYLLGLTMKEIISSRMTCKELYNKCTENPYSVAAIPIAKCEDILSRFDKKVDQESRERGLIIRSVWNNLTSNGWTATPTRLLRKRFPSFRDHLEPLKEHYEMVIDMETAYLKFAHRTELFVSDYICKKVNENKIVYNMPLETNINLESGEIIFRKSATFSRELSEEQMKAIQGALDHSLCIITGSGGSGKTACIKEIVNNLAKRNVEYAICAFTGKAVNRLREVTSDTTFSSTIHRLISKSSVASPKHLIIDEISMVTIELFYDLIKAFPDIEKITLVGDVNQLQPIDWGSLFRELLKSETIPTYKLSKNHRVYTVDGEIDGIILNANMIIKHDTDYPFEFIETNNFTVLEGTQDLVSIMIKACFANKIAANQLVILTPFNKELAGLNKFFQDIYNSKEKFELDSRGIKWVIGDRVMLTENDYDINVFNGESGIVSDVKTNVITVDFGSSGEHNFLLEPTREQTKYKYQDEGRKNEERTVLRLTHSYAITVDKSQGSEWDFVIFYIPEFNLGSFLNRSRIYTALTRAKRCIWSVVSHIESYAASSVKAPPYRCENLAKRISSKLPKLAPFKIASDLEMANDIGNIPEPDFEYDCDDY